MRRCRRVAAVCAGVAALSACNGLTGVSALEVIEEGVEAPDSGSTSADASLDQTSATVDAPADLPDSGADDATIVPDAPVDVAVDARPCTPTSAGPRYGTTATGDVWSNDNGILAPNDGSYAHTNGGGEPITITGFGFTIPAGARIDGIKVDFGRTAVGTVTDEGVSLSKGNAQNGGVWPVGPLEGPYVIKTYGGATDKWNATWSASEINAGTFSVTIDILAGGDGHADSVGVTVYYCQ